MDEGGSVPPILHPHEGCQRISLGAGDINQRNMCCFCPLLRNSDSRDLIIQRLLEKKLADRAQQRLAQSQVANSEKPVPKVSNNELLTPSTANSKVIITETSLREYVNNAATVTDVSDAYVKDRTLLYIWNEMISNCAYNFPLRIEEGLWLATSEAADNEGMLNRFNITHVFTSSKSVPHQDTNIIYTNIREDKFDECFNYIEEAKATGGDVLVVGVNGGHVTGGVRAVLAYLMKKHAMCLASAMSHINSIWRKAWTKLELDSISEELLQNFENSLEGNKFDEAKATGGDVLVGCVNGGCITGCVCAVLAYLTKKHVMCLASALSHIKSKWRKAWTKLVLDSISEELLQKFENSLQVEGVKIERPDSNKFRLGRNIMTSNSAAIFLGTCIHTNEEVVVKLETVGYKRPKLLNESKIFKSLQGESGIPNLRWFGVEEEYNVLVMDLLGPSLGDLHLFYRGKLSLKTVLMLADQMISLVENIHSKSFILREFKPSNFLMGSGEHAHQVYVVDLGRAVDYTCPRTQGTVRYGGYVPFSSVRSHHGIELGRRDDLESLGYLLVYFLKGSRRFPWARVNGKTKKERFKEYKELKVGTSVEALCRGCPTEFASYIQYCRSLRSDETPDYGYLRRIFSNLFYQEGFKYDWEYDWNVQNSCD